MTDNTENIYTLCLKKGYECGDSGVSYIDMVKYLESNGHKITDNFHTYFYIWFYDNFYHAGVTLDRLWIRDVQRQVPWRFDVKLYNQPHEWFTDKCPMMLNARQKYLDYLYLKESDRKSNIAIIISVASIILTLFVSGWQIYYADKQDKFNSEGKFRYIKEFHHQTRHQCCQPNKVILNNCFADTLLQKLHQITNDK